jgi:hypothetical protein
MKPWHVGAIVALVLGAAAPLHADEVRQLFNGKDLSGWVIDGPTEYKDKATGQTLPLWTVRDGKIVTAGRGFGFLRHDREQFADFKLHVEYRMSKNANSGIGIRTGKFDPKKSAVTRPSYFSYEVQLLDDAGKKADKHGSGSLYRYVAPKVNAVKPSPEWNTVEIECRGPRIRIAMNGHEVLDVDQTTIPEIKNKPLKGYVCLQSHTNQVEFRKVWIEPIQSTEAK